MPIYKSYAQLLPVDELATHRSAVTTDFYKHPRAPRYPYTVASNFRNFPYSWFWKNNRWVRFYVYASLFIAPVVWKVHKLINSDANKAKWESIRAHKRHDWAVPPTEIQH